MHKLLPELYLFVVLHKPLLIHVSQNIIIIIIIIVLPLVLVGFALIQSEKPCQ